MERDECLVGKRCREERKSGRDETICTLLISLLFDTSWQEMHSTSNAPKQCMRNCGMYILTQTLLSTKEQIPYSGFSLWEKTFATC